jgi:hypothetical protein
MMKIQDLSCSASLMEPFNRGFNERPVACSTDEKTELLGIYGVQEERKRVYD